MSKCWEFVPCQPFRNPSRVRIRRQNVLASPDVGFQISFFCSKNVQLTLLLCWCRQGQICSWGSCKVMAVPIRHKMLLHLNPDLSKDWALCKGSSRVVPTLQFRCIIILLEQKMCSPVCCPSYKVVGTDLPFSLRQREPLVCPGLSLAIFHLQFLFQRDFVICFFPCPSSFLLEPFGLLTKWNRGRHLWLCTAVMAGTAQPSSPRSPCSCWMATTELSGALKC